MPGATIRLGPVEIRDPANRNRQQGVQRVDLAHYLWSDPTRRVVYISGLTDSETPEEPPGISIEMRVQDAIEHYQKLGALLQSAGYLRVKGR